MKRARCMSDRFNDWRISAKNIAQEILTVSRKAKPADVLKSSGPNFSEQLFRVLYRVAARV